MTGRGLFFAPGNTTGPMPLPSVRAGAFLAFDATGLNPVCIPGGTGTGSVNGPNPTVPGDIPLWANVNGTLLSDSGVSLNSQPANKFLATPSNAAGKPAMRAIVGADLPLATTSSPGAVPALPGNTTTFFRGDGTFAPSPGQVASFEALTGAIAASSADKRIYVSTAGNDSNTGLSPQSAKLTLQAAVNAANPGGVIYVGAGTYTLTSTLSMQPGVGLQCAQGATIIQGNAANLAIVIDFSANSANGGSIRGCTVDGNRANNTTGGTVGVVNIGTANDVVVEQNTIQNSTMMGVKVTTGLRPIIRNNTIQSNFYAGVFQLNTTSINTVGEVAGNKFLQAGAHAIIVEGASGWRIHDNFIQGVLITGLTVTTTGGNTVIVTAGGTPFSNTCSGTTICPGNFVVTSAGAAFQELFVTSIVNSTTALVTGLTASGTGGAAIAGTGDLIDIAAVSSDTDVYNNFLSNGAGGGLVDATFGDSGNTGSHEFGSYRGNTVISIGGNCIAIEASSTNSVSNMNVLDNRVTNCLLGGAAIYEVAAAIQGAIFISGADIGNIWMNGNSISDVSGTGTPFWIVAGSGVPNGSISSGKNFIVGMANGTTVSGNTSAVTEVP
jgi:parallel beta-helix repeat protein